MSLNEEERRNCSYDATQQEIEPMIEPAKRLIDKVSDYISK